MENIAIIGSDNFSSKNGKFETLVHNLVQELGNKVRFTIYYSSDGKSDKKRPKNTFKLSLVNIPVQSKGHRKGFYVALSILHAIFKANTLFVIGVSGSFMFPLLRLFTSKKLIVLIDGLEWKRKKMNRIARFLNKWSEKIAVKWAHSVVSDNEAFKQYIYSEYSVLSERIEYGADHVTAMKPCQEDYRKYPFLANSYAFNIARVEPENNVELVLEAFISLPLTLVIVGNWKQNSYARKLKAKYSKYKNIFMLEQKLNQEHMDILRSNCWLYVHGNTETGTNISLIEAMQLGLPIIAYDDLYNKETTEYKCEYFNSVETLKKAIANIKFYDLKRIGDKMFEISMNRYSWSLISSLYLRLFLTDKKILNRNKLILSLNSSQQKYLQNQERYQLIYQHFYFEEID